MNTIKKSTMKKLLVALFAIALMAALAVFANAEGEVTTVASGYCGGEGDGTNLTWTLDSEGTLTISGKGEMKDYNDPDIAPWDEQRHRIDSVVVSDNITSIGDYALRDCDVLISVSIPDSVTSIGVGAFYGCVNLSSFSIPSHLTTIGMAAFKYCSKLRFVTIPSSVTSIGNQTFSFCNNLIAITVDPDNSYYMSDIYGCLFNKRNSSLIQYPTASVRTKYNIPNNVQRIEYAAFSNCVSLTSVFIPSNVNDIQYAAFYNCTNLRDVYYAGSESDWADVYIMETGNESILNANIHFNSSPDVHNHSFVSTVTVPPTCKTPGEETFTCECGDTYTEELPIDPDAHDMQIGAYVPETCTTGGYAPWVCTRCGKENRTDIVPALGHLWDAGEVITPATCSTTGTIRYTCKREGCGETKDAELKKDPNAHVYKVTVVPPDCLNDGYTSHACTLCRYGYADNEVPALGHAALDENGDCPRCHQHIKDVPQPETPAGSSDEQEAPKQNFFQRIIQWFKDFFAKLFGKKK